MGRILVASLAATAICALAACSTPADGPCESCTAAENEYLSTWVGLMEGEGGEPYDITDHEVDVLLHWGERFCAEGWANDTEAAFDAMGASPVEDFFGPEGAAEASDEFVNFVNSGILAAAMTSSPCT